MDVRRYPPLDFDRLTVETIRAVESYTLTTPERIAALCQAVRYVAANSIDGAIVECGVWRGGSMMAAARTLLEVGDTARDLYLFDTFDGMVAPGEFDRRSDGRAADDILATEDRANPHSGWARVPSHEVRLALRSVGYPETKCHFIEGPVERTIPDHAPTRIAILRLDTDWYESTKHEMSHLYPRISDRGVLLIDDYGAWQGARKAVDEYLAGEAEPLFLNRIDNTGRIAVVQRERPC